MSDQTFTREALEELPRKALQALAKSHSVKANQKSAIIIEQLLALAAVPSGDGKTLVGTEKPSESVRGEDDSTPEAPAPKSSAADTPVVTEPVEVASSEKVMEEENEKPATKKAKSKSKTKPMAKAKNKSKTKPMAKNKAKNKTNATDSVSIEDQEIPVAGEESAAAAPDPAVPARNTNTTAAAAAEPIKAPAVRPVAQTAQHVQPVGQKSQPCESAKVPAAVSAIPPKKPSAKPVAAKPKSTTTAPKTEKALFTPAVSAAAHVKPSGEKRRPVLQSSKTARDDRALSAAVAPKSSKPAPKSASKKRPLSDLKNTVPSRSGPANKKRAGAPLETELEVPPSASKRRIGDFSAVHAKLFANQMSIKDVYDRRQKQEKALRAGSYASPARQIARGPGGSAAGISHTSGGVGKHGLSGGKPSGSSLPRPKFDLQASLQRKPTWKLKTGPLKLR